MKPFSNALRAYHAGDHSASFVIEREGGFQQEVPAASFFSDHEFPNLEARCGSDLSHPALSLSQ